MPNSLPAIKDQLAIAIENVGHFRGQNFRYEARGGHVTLHGTVDSYFQKQMAQETVRRVDGVQDVTNLLEVSWSDSNVTTPV